LQNNEGISENSKHTTGTLEHSNEEGVEPFFVDKLRGVLFGIAHHFFTLLDLWDRLKVQKIRAKESDHIHERCTDLDFLEHIVIITARFEESLSLD
jgi:hypothetical protein